MARYVHPITKRRDVLILAHLQGATSITRHDRSLMHKLSAAGLLASEGNASYLLGSILATMYERKLLNRRQSAPYIDPTWGAYYLQCWEYYLPGSDDNA